VHTFRVPLRILTASDEKNRDFSEQSSTVCGSISFDADFARKIASRTFGDLFSTPLDKILRSNRWRR